MKRELDGFQIFWLQPQRLSMRKISFAQFRPKFIHRKKFSLNQKIFVSINKNLSLIHWKLCSSKVWMIHCVKTTRENYVSILYNLAVQIFVGLAVQIFVGLTLQSSHSCSHGSDQTTNSPDKRESGDTIDEYSIVVTGQWDSLGLMALRPLSLLFSYVRE